MDEDLENVKLYVDILCVLNRSKGNGNIAYINLPHELRKK